MTVIRTFNESAQRRLIRAAKKIEALHPGNRVKMPRPSLAPSMTFIGLAQAHIEHNTIGNCKAAEGTDYTSNLSATGDTLRVYNPGPRVWNGSPIAIEHWALAGATETRYVIRYAWSATRIRGIARNTILPTENGYIDQVKPLNGHLGDVSVIATLQTQNHSVAQNLVVWAELVYVEATQSSEWQIYQADCP